MKQRKWSHWKPPVIDASRGWSGNLTADRSSWHQNDGPPNFRDVGAIVLISAALVFGCVLAAYLLTEGLLLASEKLLGRHYIAFSLWSDPVIWIPVLGAAGITALLLTFLSAVPLVVSFDFDIRNRTLVYTESRLGRSPRMSVVPFESIVSVRPRLLTTYATDGDFEITLCQSEGHAVTKHMGRGIPLVALLAHADWLKSALGDRVEPTLQLDT